MKLKTKEPTTADPARPYPEGIAWDEALRQRKRADRLEVIAKTAIEWVEIAGMFDVAVELRNAMEHQYDE